MANNLISSIQYNSGDIGVFTTPYGVCSTAASTAAKTVDAVGDFALASGARILIKFTVTNTASSPTLNVDSSGAKAIYYNGAAITAGYLKANKIYEFVYDGTYWQFIGDIDTNSNTAHSHSAGVGLTGSGNAGTSGTYTYKAKLRSETAQGSDSSATATGHLEPIVVDKSGYLAVKLPSASDLSLSQALRFVGVTTSALKDGSTTNPILINNVEVTATIGSVVLDSTKTKEYVWTGGEWEMLGASNSYALKDHKHTVTHKPEGTVSKPSFTGTEVSTKVPNETNKSTTVASSSHSHKYTPAGTISQPTFSGTTATIPASTAKDSVSVAEHTHSVTVTGTVSQPTFSGTVVAGHTHSVTATGSVSLGPTISNYRLTLNPTFSGNSVNTSSAGGHTPAGTISQPTWTQASGSASAHASTQAVEVSLATHTHGYTPAGTVSKPTFTGTEASTTSITGTVDVASTSHTHNVTAQGTVSQPTFTGSSATLTTSVPTTTPDE